MGDQATVVELWRAIAIASNVAVAVGYAGLGIFLAPKFDAGAPTWVLTIFKVSGLAFFLLCADTHIHEAYHIWDGLLSPEYWLDLHYLGMMIAQGVAAATSLVLALGFINVRVFDKRYTRALLDRMLEETVDELARRDRSRRISDSMHNVRQVREIADLMLAAYQRDTEGHGRS
jgi:hypothetical protein